MKIKNLSHYLLEDDGTPVIGDKVNKINIINGCYTIGTVPTQYQIRIHEHMKFTRESGARVKHPRVYLIREQDKNNCQIYVVLTKLQELKFRLMFVSGKGVFGKIVSGVSTVFKFLLNLV